ncbi:kinase-like domain-containing protein [Aspergillus caelatus]|uniref:Altered inheritance of mitochondria protein 9, mitochondrial n=1 Tax=Aspergillus caelatus TaxID=61420 RepID=A0A5N6ZJL4_9EURO|nr:kinase-like domain-containing protein [Aspergillus caelatus]KAE8357814.1 kinase-like domain-containing protein [Aspergillus caelatus]
MDDGNEVIAKIPCPNAGPPSLTTASEVATLKFLRSKTSIRVPEVLAWSSDAANAVGAEFIIMEKIKGIALSEIWEAMNTLERYKIIDQIVQIEKELAHISFPAYGSLFLRESLPATYRQYPLPPNLDPEGLFCIGPSCKRTWWHGNFIDINQPISEDMGPWVRFSEYASSIVQREFAHIAKARDEVQRQLHNFDESQSIVEYENLLEKVNMILPVLSHDTRVTDVSNSVIWHTDLHLGNIFVSLNEPSIVEGIIDWQSSQLCPLFIQAQFPEFITPPKGYNPGTDLPSLPDGFDDLSSEQKEQATIENELASRSKYYEMSSLAHNKHVYNAMKLDRRLWEPFTYCQLFSHGSLVPLRHCLIRLYQDWSLLGLPGSCPFLISEHELQRHEKQKLQYEDRLYLWDLVKNQLSTDNAGWVPNSRWEATEKANKELYNMYIETMSEELTPQAAAKNWPFPPQQA